MDRLEQMLEMQAALEIAAGHLQQGNHTMALATVEKVLDCVNAYLKNFGQSDRMNPSDSHDG